MYARRIDGNPVDGRRSERIGYPSADDLMTSLRGDDGPERHALALGYLMAIQDTDADCVEGQRLLSNLRGEQGEELRHVASGYVAAVRDDFFGSGAGRALLIDAEPRPNNPTDVDAVRAWMERHPPRTGEMALPIVRAAIKDSYSRRTASRTVLAGRALLRNWSRMPSALIATSIAALAAISISVGFRHLGSAPGDQPPTLRDSLELSEVSSRLVTLVLEERRFEKDSFINLQSADAFTGYERQWNDHRSSFAGLMSRASRIRMSDQDRRAFEQMNSDFQEYTRGYEAVVAQIEGGVVRTTRQANDAIGPFKDAVHRIETNSIAIRERAESRLSKAT